MQRTPHTDYSKTRAPLPGSLASSAEDSFKQSLRDIQSLSADRWSDAIKALLNQVDLLPHEAGLEALVDLAIKTAALSDRECCEVADLIIIKLQDHIKSLTADQRLDHAQRISSALLSAAELQTTPTLLEIAAKLSTLNQSLPTDHLAQFLVSEVRQHLKAKDSATTNRNLIQAAAMVRHLPTTVRTRFLESLNENIPADPESRCEVLPVLINQLGYLPGNQDCQDLTVRINQQLYQSRLAAAGD